MNKLTTKQEVFDHIVTFLSKQGEKCSHFGHCKLRFEGKRCAIGALIDDERYRPALENMHVGDPGILKAIEYSCGFGAFANERFLIDMQCAHDEMHDQLCPKFFRLVAEKYSLNADSVKRMEALPDVSAPSEEAEAEFTEELQ